MMTTFGVEDAWCWWAHLTTLSIYQLTKKKNLCDSLSDIRTHRFYTPYLPIFIQTQAHASLPAAYTHLMIGLVINMSVQAGMPANIYANTNSAHSTAVVYKEPNYHLRVTGPFTRVSPLHQLTPRQLLGLLATPCKATNSSTLFNNKPPESLYSLQEIAAVLAHTEVKQQLITFSVNSDPALWTDSSQSDRVCVL